MTTKHDKDKPRYDLLPPLAIDAMAEVMTFGAKKYAPNNWRTVPDAVSRYQAALLRHSFAMLRGEVNNLETGLPHAAHVMCCAAFIVELQNMNQLQLPLPSDLTHAIAEAIAWERGRDYPNDTDWHDAAEKADKWNRRRVELGLEPYR